MKNIGEHAVRIEAEALRALADRIAGPMASAFQRAVDLMFYCAGRVVVTGMGKSASGRGAAWGFGDGGARRCGAGALGKRRD